MSNDSYAIHSLWTRAELDDAIAEFGEYLFGDDVDTESDESF